MRLACLEHASRVLLETLPRHAAKSRALCNQHRPNLDSVEIFGVELKSAAETGGSGRHRARKNPCTHTKSLVKIPIFLPPVVGLLKNAHRAFFFLPFRPRIHTLLHLLPAPTKCSNPSTRHLQKNSSLPPFNFNLNPNSSSFSLHFILSL